MTLSLQRPVIERVRENEDKYISFSGRRKVFFLPDGGKSYKGNKLVRACCSARLLYIRQVAQRSFSICAPGAKKSGGKGEEGIENKGINFEVSFWLIEHIFLQ